MLEGAFQDEHGDYPAGFYVRNPPTSRHTPRSAPACVLFVTDGRWHIETAKGNTDVADVFICATGFLH